MNSKFYKWVRPMVLIGVLAISVLSSVGFTKVKAAEDQALINVDRALLKAGELSAYRWKAMANFYASHLENDFASADAVKFSTDSWNAMANFYASQAQSALISDFASLEAVGSSTMYHHWFFYASQAQSVLESEFESADAIDVSVFHHWEFYASQGHNSLDDYSTSVDSGEKGNIDGNLRLYSPPGH